MTRLKALKPIRQQKALAMANLSISTVCNLQCVYCFTSDYQETTASERHFMPLEDFDARLDFLDRSGIDELRLLGGEPTLHPDFVELVRRGRLRGKTITLFTNGLMPDAVLDCLAELPVPDCFVLMNINAPEENRPHHLARQRAALKRLGPRAMPGFNIHRPDFKLDFLFDLIEETGCKPTIRLGLAHPCLSGSNHFIHPKQYRFIAQQLAYFAEDAAHHGINFDFDCGFVPCMFAPEELDRLETLGTRLGWHCNPILDVDIDGNVFQCYPLAQLGSLPLTPETDAAALRQEFERRTGVYRQVGIFQECAVCPARTAGTCKGGCLATAMRRLHHTPFCVTV